jgi:NTE family protein
LIVTGGAAQVDDGSPFTRPKVGLVLSSGGARGLAHIGVLKALEESGIPIDCIAGSSMGCVIGALYACGYSASQLDSLARTLDWVSIFEGKPDRKRLKPVQRGRENHSLFRIDLSPQGPRLPVSLFSEHRVNQQFFRLTAPANFQAGGDFSRLPIPFCAVSVDLKTGKLCILREGNLARAMRASMAIPIIFPPVEMDGEMLIDGGMIDNLPTDALKKWDPQIILGVDASSDMPIQDSTYDLIDVGKQVIKIWMIISNRSILVKPSVLIEPDLGSHSPLFYGKTAWLIGQGFEAAMAKMDSIRLLVGETNAGRRKHLRKAYGWPDLKAYKVARVRIEGNVGVNSSLILNRFSVRPGDPVDLHDIEAGVANLRATNLFREIWVDLEPMGCEEAEVVLHTLEREHRKFQVAGNYANEKSGTVRFSLKDENLFKSAECVSLAFKWGKLFSLGEFFVQKDNIVSSPFFLDIKGGVGVEKPLYYHRGREKGKFRFWRQRGEVSFGLEWGYKGWTSVGMVAEKGNFEGPPSSFLEEQDFVGRGIVLKANFDNLNSTSFPTQGYSWNAEGTVFPKGWGSTFSFTRFLSRWEVHFPITTDMTISTWCRVGLSDGEVPYSYLFRVGGPGTLAGFHRDELWGEQTISVGVSGNRQLEKFFIVRVGFLGGNVWGKVEEMDAGELKWGVTLGAVLRMPFGPISLDWGLGENHRSLLYVTVGYDLS